MITKMSITRKPTKNSRCHTILPDGAISGRFSQNLVKLGKVFLSDLEAHLNFQKPLLSKVWCMCFLVGEQAYVYNAIIWAGNVHFSVSFVLAGGLPVGSQSIVTIHVGIHQWAASPREPETYASKPETSHRLCDTQLDHANISNAEPGAYWVWDGEMFRNFVVHLAWSEHGDVMPGERYAHRSDGETPTYDRLGTVDGPWWG